MTNPDDFYTSACTKRLYQQHAAAMASRRNTHNGRVYRCALVASQGPPLQAARPTGSQADSSKTHQPRRPPGSLLVPRATAARPFTRTRRDDPTILAWDLLNEPRCDCYFNHQSGGRCSRQLDQWIGEMGAYMKVGAGLASESIIRLPH